MNFISVANGSVQLRVAVAGTGPLILCVHGWPELWVSWRHQMEEFSSKGYTVAAMDVRGYGGSSKPAEVEAYTLKELCSDTAAVIDSLGDGLAIVLGHDWGAPIAWNTARLYRDKVRAVAGLSVPYLPVGPNSSLELWEELYKDKFFYQKYFQAPGVAEAELSADTRVSLRKLYFALSGDGHQQWLLDKPADAALLDGLIDPDPFPSWLPESELDLYVEALEQGGWHGPLNRYRAQSLDAAQLGSLPDPELTQPATFIGGEHDPVRRFVPGMDIFELASAACSDFRGATVVPGAGHWVQQEAPIATNAALTAFLESL